MFGGGQSERLRFGNDNELHTCTHTHTHTHTHMHTLTLKTGFSGGEVNTSSADSLSLSSVMADRSPPEWLGLPRGSSMSGVNRSMRSSK